MVLEPDVIVNDLETIEPNDALLVTTMSNLIQIERQLDQKQLEGFFGSSEESKRDELILEDDTLK